MAMDITITSIETITAFAITTGNYMWTLDELQNASVAQTQELTEITGKQGRRLSTMKRNKAATVSATNGFISGGLLETQTGGTFSNKATKVIWMDNLVVDSSNSATTAYKAVGTTGAEIDALYIRQADGTLGEALTQGSTAAAGTFTYTPGTKKLQFYTDVPENSEVVVYYKRNITADVLTNESDKYSGKCQLYVDCFGEDKCGNIYRVQFYFPKADVSGDFTFDMGDSQTVHAFEANIESGACGAGGAMWTYTIFGANTADTPVE